MSRAARPRLGVLAHLRPKPRKQAPTWQQCCQKIAEWMNTNPQRLWPTLRRLTMHVRDPRTGDFTITDVDLDAAIAAPIEGEA